MKTTRRFALVAGTSMFVAGRKFVYADEDLPPEAPYTDVTGQLLDLKFTMSLASTGAVITEKHFVGHPVILYFGFTRCTDICPLTMENAARVIHKMGLDGQKLRVLFVTIDPDYDTLSRVATYVANFGSAPVIDGLRGTSAQLSTFAARYDVEYTTVTSADSPDPVSNIAHSEAVYAFGPDGKARYILGTLADDKPDLRTVAALMTTLVSA